MKEVTTSMNLPDGTSDVTYIEFEEEDRILFLELYNAWQKASKLSVELKGRKFNLPESLSEGLFSLEMGVGRVLNCSNNGVNSSWDCIDPKTTTRIQVKACSVLPDLTSFGPRSVWDKLYFCDFSRLDGTFTIYLIPNDYVYDRVVSTEKGKKETMRDQQKQGRRPRMKIIDIINEKKLTPVKIGSVHKLK